MTHFPASILISIWDFAFLATNNFSLKQLFLCNINEHPSRLDFFLYGHQLDTMEEHKHSTPTHYLYLQKQNIPLAFTEHVVESKQK